MGHVIRVYIYCRNNKVLRLRVSLCCYIATKENSTTLLFLELHTLVSDQLITSCSLTNYFLSDNLTGARMLASIATYFQLGKPVTGKHNQIVTNCVVSLVANKES